MKNSKPQLDSELALGGLVGVSSSRLASSYKVNQQHIPEIAVSEHVCPERETLPWTLFEVSSDVIAGESRAMANSNGRQLYLVLEQV